MAHSIAVLHSDLSPSIRIFYSLYSFYFNAISAVCRVSQLNSELMSAGINVPRELECAYHRTCKTIFFFHFFRISLVELKCTNIVNVVL